MGDVHDLPPDREAVAAPLLHRYTSPDEDSARGWDFPSARARSSSAPGPSEHTWVQMICLLMLFREVISGA
jgi:hypothetical protein